MNTYAVYFDGQEETAVELVYVVFRSHAHWTTRAPLEFENIFKTKDAANKYVKRRQENNPELFFIVERKEVLK